MYNVNNMICLCKIFHVNLNNKDSAAECYICQIWVHMKCNTLNHIDYKHLQGSNDPWYCFSCCNERFPFGILTNKYFISSTSNSPQGTNSDNDNESLFSLKLPSDLALLYNQFKNNSPEFFFYELIWCK